MKNSPRMPWSLLTAFSCAVFAGNCRAASDVTVSSAATSGGTFSAANPSVFTPTAPTAVAEISTIQSKLDAGTGVTINTASAAGGAGDLTVSETLAKSAGTATTLRLNAVRDLLISAPLYSSVGEMPVVLTAGRSISNTQLVQTNGGNLTLSPVQTFTASALLDAGTGQVLLQSGALESSGGQTLTAATVQTSSGTALRWNGNITGDLIAGGPLSAGAGTTAGGISVSGNLTLAATAATTVQIGGTWRGGNYDSLTAAAAVSVAGTLAVQITDGFEDSISPADVFTVVEGASLAGTFTGYPDQSRFTLPGGLGSLRVNYTTTAVLLDDWRPVITPIAWDPGITQAGTQIHNHVGSAAGSYWFKVTVPAGAENGMRVWLHLTAGEAALYVKKGSFPRPWDYHYQSAAAGNDIVLVQPDQVSAGEEWHILVRAEAGAQWNLLAGEASLPLTWDPGTTHAGTAVYAHPGTESGYFWFRLTAQALAEGAWRNALTVTAGEAHLYFSRNQLPQPWSWHFKSERAGSDGFVLRPDQCNVGEQCYLLVHVPVTAAWSLVSGDAFVQNLGALQFTDGDSDNIYDLSETPLESGSGAVSVGPEGMRWFKATVPNGTPAWALWTGGTGHEILVRRNLTPFTDYGTERRQAGRMLLVPDYLQASADVYYIGIADAPGAAVHLRSRIQAVTDVAFGSTQTVNSAGTDAGYRTFRVQVPIDQIAWENAVTNVSGDGNVCLRRDMVPNEFHNDAIADTAGIVTDSVTLSPPTLTNGTFFITIYGTASFQVSFRNGNPVVTTVPYVGTSVNDSPAKAGWRYYVVTDIGSQFGQGWELELTGAPSGTEIAIRRNAVPARWRYRNQESFDYYVEHGGHVDQFSRNGLLQQVDHQADIWYIGIYNPSAALGAFTLTRRLPVPAPLAFAGGTSAQTGHFSEVWRWFAVTVPAGPLGWDVRIRDVTAGRPVLAVRRDLLPGDLGGWYAGHQYYSGSNPWWSPGASAVWPSGQQWAENLDLTQRRYDADGRDALWQHLTCGMNRPLEPGTYYIGVRNDHPSEPAAYTLESRGLGAGQAIGVTDVAFAGGSEVITGLAPRDLRLFKFTVPADTPHWSLRLTPSVGDLMMMVRLGGVPSDNGDIQPYWYPQAHQADAPGMRVFKQGAEHLSIFPANTESFLPAGDYYVAVMSDGDTPADSQTTGAAPASGTLTSLGSPLTSLGTALLEVPLTNAVSLAGGETKVYAVNIPAGTATLEVRLDDRTGNPRMAARPGGAAPYFNSYTYGYDGGSTAGTQEHPNVITFANPPAGAFTITVRAAPLDSNPQVFPDATTTLVVTSLPAALVAFNGGTAIVTGQEAATWRYFRVDVPAGPLGWDLRVKNVTSGQPVMAVRRDLLPADLGGWYAGYQYYSGSNPWWSPGASSTWPSAQQWAEPTDLTQRNYDADGRYVLWQHLTCAMNHPLEPGTYYVGVRNDHASQAAAYALESRGLGAGMAIGVTDVSFAGGSANITSLAPRDLRVFKVTVPADTPHWSLRLTPSTGDLMMMVRRGGVPSDNGDLQPYWYPQAHHTDTPGKRVTKSGSEFLTIFPAENETVIPAGDYFVTVMSDGDTPADYNTAGAGPSSGTLTSLGAPLTPLGTALTGVPLTNAVTLTGGQTKVFSVDVPAGAAALEVRLDNCTGYPRLAARAGTAGPFFGSQFYGYDGGTGPGSQEHTSEVTFANPPAGIFTITVRASHHESDGNLWPDASATLVVTSLPPAPVTFNGGTAAVTGQAPAAWKFFRVEVPAGPLGWDLRVRNVTGGQPSMTVRRDLLPGDIGGWYAGYQYYSGNNPWWSPGASSAWPTAQQWAEPTDLTQRNYDADGRFVLWQHLTCAMNHPLEPGTYFVGVKNEHATEAAAYTLESRGLGAGQAIVATDVAFSGGSASITNLAPRDLRVFKVTVPAGTPHWSLRLTAGTGDLMMMVRRGGVPTDNGDFQPYWYPRAHHTESPGMRVTKPGSEFLTIFPAENETVIPAGDYYITVMSDGDTPSDSNHAGAGPSSGTLTSLGAPFTALGTALPAVPLSQAVGLSSGQTKVFTVNVPAGTATLEVRLDDRTGNPRLAARAGMAPPYINPYDTRNYGCDGGTTPGTQEHQTVLSFPNPPAGPFTITVRAAHHESDGNLWPDATATLVVTSIPPAPLNFGSYANGGGGSNQDSRQIIDGAKVLYQIAVPPTIAGQPVLAWKLDAVLAQGDVRLKVFKNFATRTPFVETTLDTAVIAPPFFTPGDTWYLEVTGLGVTDYTIISEPATLQRPAWTMPPDGQLSTTPGLIGSTTFGDSGLTTGGAPLPGDQGLDLGQDDWHFYAVTVPPGNRGVLRTVLEAINGDPNLYLRRADIPAPLHRANPDYWWEPVLRDYEITGTGTHYNNWVPIFARYETELAPGTWYLGVTAASGTNCRYRLRTTVGDFQTLALNGGSFTGQMLLGDDWRYYRVDIPESAPVNWDITFATTQGSVQVHWRTILPPGDSSGNPLAYGDQLRNAHDDQLNQGPYQSEGWNAPGSYTIGTPPLRPGSRVYLGVKANNDAQFSISSATSGDAIPAATALDFAIGAWSGSVEPGLGPLFKITVPPDAARLKFTATNSVNIEFRLEQGTLPQATGAVHWQGGPGWTNLYFNQYLREPNAWPWQPGLTYYLRLINQSGAAESVSIQMNGRTLANDDEDNDGMLDAWERQFLNTTGYAGYDDADGDGLENRVEYAFGLHPGNSASLLVPPPVLTGGRWRFEYNTPAGMAAITVGAEYSTDMVSWTNIPDTGTGGHHVFLAPPGGRQYVRWKVSGP